MKLLKRTRTSRTKLLTGLIAEGGVYFYTKKPSGRRADYVGTKAKVLAAMKEPSIRIDKK